MRLIDADRLKAIISNTYYKPHEVIGIINSRPTVNAISIEWLKEWFNTKMNSTLLPKNFEMVCSWIIYDWEKENE